jgi:hypothetical protein
VIDLIPPLIEKQILYKFDPCRLRISCFYGDYLVVVNKYNEKNELQKTKLFLHFGHRNTRFREAYYTYRNDNQDDIAKIFETLAFRIYGEGNWSNNDRLRKGLAAISISKIMKRKP